MSQAFLSGQWADDRACRTDTTYFDQFGRVTFKGANTFNYSLTLPNVLTYALPTGPLSLTVQVVDRDTVLLTGPGGSSPLYRCSTAARAPGYVPAPGYAPPAGYALPPLSTAFLTGKWKDNGLCIGKTDIEFNMASQVSFKRSAFVNYAVTGPNTITLSGPGGSLTVIVNILEPGKISVSDGTGTTEEAWRC